MCQNPNEQNNINYENPKGHTPLIVAAQEGHIEVVRLLLSHPDIDVECRDLQGLNAFDWAAYEGHLEIIKMIYQHLLTVKTPQEVERFVKTGGWKGRTPFHCACLKGHENVVKYLVNVVNVDISKKDNDNKTGKQYAFKNGQFGHKAIVLWLAHRDKTVIGEIFVSIKYGEMNQKYMPQHLVIYEDGIMKLFVDNSVVTLNTTYDLTKMSSGDFVVNGRLWSIKMQREEDVIHFAFQSARDSYVVMEWMKQFIVNQEEKENGDDMKSEDVHQMNDGMQSSLDSLRSEHDVEMEIDEINNVFHSLIYRQIIKWSVLKWISSRDMP